MLYALMGWLVVVALRAIVAALPPLGLGLLVEQWSITRRTRFMSGFRTPWYTAEAVYSRTRLKP